MPTTFVNTIDENEILAKRSQCDYAGNDIQTTYATKSELPTATSDLTNDSDFITSSDIPVKDVQVGGESVVNAQGIAEISIPQTGVLDVEVDGSSVVNAQGVAEITLPTFTQVNSDWDASSGVSEILNKPDLSIYAESSDLATVATSGSYNDLLDKPSIPSAQVNADWDATSGVSAILNKPNLATVATTGDYSDLQNLPSIPAAQVNSDWSATSGVAQILNKPSIPTATSDLTNDSDYITLSDVPAQVNADWDATSGVSAILNKPSIPTVDQNYNSSSTNAQSGTAVAQAIASIPSPSYTAGNGIDITSDVISAKVDGTTVSTNASGELTVIGGGGGSQVNSDWDATSGVAEILNKPVPKTLTAGSNITITENASTITIGANVPAPTPQVNADWDAVSGAAEILNKPTVDQSYDGTSTNAQSGVAVADAIGNLPTNLSAAQLQALKEALGVDETVLWDNYTFADNKSASVVMSEDPFNFSHVRITFEVETSAETWPTIQTQIVDMVALNSSVNKYFTLNGTCVNGTTIYARCSKCHFNGTAISDDSSVQWYNGSSGAMTAPLHIYRIVGIHRIASN